MPELNKRTTQRRESNESRNLGRYHAKRDLAVSGEPAGGKLKGRVGEVRRFVIQKHDATRLHYDFRLEMDGVYRSWAVPKGLPTTPGDRALAVEVEDHPLEYGNFEGIIPAGNYGAGSVMLWDRGHYTVSGVAPERAYREGKMHLALAGEKCLGEWTLVRMHSRPGDKHTNWLVIKNNSPAHRAAMTGTQRDLSVLSHRSMDEIAGDVKPAKRSARIKPPPRRVKNTGGLPSPRANKRRSPKRSGSNPRPVAARERGTTAVAKKNSLPRTRGNLAPAKFILPMKALSVDEVPRGKWRLEIKLDGYRAVAVINEGKVELWSRNRKPLTADYPEVVAALDQIRCRNAVIDGEIVALDERGHSRFQLMQNRGNNGRVPIVYYVFDLLHHDGRSLLDTPIEERQMALEVLVGKGSEALRFSPVFEIAPGKLLAEVRKKGLEGIIAKMPGSFYEPDRRSGAWLKCKVHGEQEFVIGGFTAPKNSRQYFGAILIGYYKDGRLEYAGKVGSGFDTARLAALHREFVKRQIGQCPFANLPAARKPRFGVGMTAAAMKHVTWVKPELVAQVQFTEWTADGSLRHPVFLGLRDDKRAREVVRE
jgi:bifunctional non-homologous end joining protein LigD